MTKNELIALAHAIAAANGMAEHERGGWADSVLSHFEFTWFERFENAVEAPFVKPEPAPEAHADETAPSA